METEFRFEVAYIGAVAGGQLVIAEPNVPEAVKEVRDLLYRLEAYESAGRSVQLRELQDRERKMTEPPF